MSSPDKSDSDLSFLDGFEQDLCSVGWDGGGTQIVPTAIKPRHNVVEESGKPTLFDMTIDDSEEVSGGVSRVHRRQCSVLVPTQLESTDTENWDGHDPQSQDEHPHSDESVVSNRMGAAAFKFLGF